MQEVKISAFAGFHSNNKYFSYWNIIWTADGNNVNVIVIVVVTVIETVIFAFKNELQCVYLQIKILINIFII